MQISSRINILKEMYAKSTPRTFERIVSVGKNEAPMCWVIPAASLSCTPVPRILSSSEVFPWSICPKTVTIGERNLTLSDMAGTSQGICCGTACYSYESVAFTKVCQMKCVIFPPYPARGRRYTINVSQELQVKQFGTLICNNQARWHSPTKSQCSSS